MFVSELSMDEMDREVIPEQLTPIPKFCVSKVCFAFAKQLGFCEKPNSANQNSVLEKVGVVCVCCFPSVELLYHLKFTGFAATGHERES